MKTLHIRFVLALTLSTGVSVFGIFGQSECDAKIAELAKPIEAAAQTVIDSTEAVRDFGSFLPGSFK